MREQSGDLTHAGRLRHRQLSEYIAASALTHCPDGWAYLGRAMHAQIVGDNDCARHLSYYAELRGAMALLASQAVGVFDRQHIVISNRGRCLRIPNGHGTHKFVWDALEEWAKEPSSSATILDLVTAGGSRLHDWLDHFASVPALAGQLTKDWLNSWGLDIARLANDRDARNLSSYRPTSLSTGSQPDAATVLRFISGLWRTCEPTAESPFTVLDRFLVKASLQNGFTAAHNRSPRHASRQFRLRIQAVVRGLQPKPVPGMDWETFLIGTGNDPLHVLTQARGKVGPEHSEHSLQVASRALLMLRLASGVGQRLLGALPASNSAHLWFWVGLIGRDRSLWQAGSAPAALTDLWMDTEAALDEIRANLKEVDSFCTLWRKFASAAGTLSSWERVGLWGLGL